MSGSQFPIRPATFVPPNAPYQGVVPVAAGGAMIKTEPSDSPSAAVVPVGADLALEVNNLISVQTIELNQWHQTTVGLEHLMGMYSEVCRIINRHSECMEMHHRMFAERDLREQELVRKLNTFASLVTSKDESREFLSSLSSLEQLLTQQRTTLELTRIDQGALNERQSTLAQQVASADQVSGLQRMVTSLHEVLKTQAAKIGELTARSTLPPPAIKREISQEYLAVKEDLRNLREAVLANQGAFDLFKQSATALFQQVSALQQQVDSLSPQVASLERVVAAFMDSTIGALASLTSRMEVLELSQPDPSEDIGALRHLTNDLGVRVVYLEKMLEERSAQGVVAPEAPRARPTIPEDTRQRWAALRNIVDDERRDHANGRRPLIDRITIFNNTALTWMKDHWKILLTSLLVWLLSEFSFDFSFLHWSIILTMLFIRFF